MANKKSSRGRHITKIGFISIYAKDTYGKDEGSKKTKVFIKHPPVLSTDLAIFKGKEKIKGGLKNIEEAIAEAIAFMGDKYTAYEKK